MEFSEVQQKVHGFLEGVRRYKRWHYRRPALVALVPLLEKEGLKAEVGKESISFEREASNGERYRITFRRDGTIGGEVYDEKGILVMVTGSIEDFFVEMLAGGAIPAKG